MSDRANQIYTPIPMRLNCPACGEIHIDEGDFATKYHHTHACQHCGMVWRPAVECTVGVRFLPGFKNEDFDPRAMVRPPDIRRWERIGCMALTEGPCEYVVHSDGDFCKHCRERAPIGWMNK